MPKIIRIVKIMHYAMKPGHQENETKERQKEKVKLEKEREEQGLNRRKIKMRYK